MAYRKIEDPQHGILLQQITLILAGNAEKEELDQQARQLYARHHELHNELERIMYDYERLNRKVRRKLPAELLV